MVAIPYEEVTVLRCRLSVRDVYLDGRSMLVQAADSETVRICMIEGLQLVKDGMIEVVVANAGPATVTFPVAYIRGIERICTAGGG